MIGLAAGVDQRGVSLVEILLAMLLGLWVAGHIVGLFIATANSDQVQLHWAVLQENGRFAIARLTSDLRKANGLYCSNTGGAARIMPNGLWLDSLWRAPRVYLRSNGLIDALHDVTTRWGARSGGNDYPPAPSAPYDMPAFFSARGYECDISACSPVDPAVGTGIPAMAAMASKRVPGTDVLTLRYLDGTRGWPLDAGGIRLAGGALAALTVAPSVASGEPNIATFSGGPVMLADCGGAQVFMANLSGTSLTPAEFGNFAGAAIAPPGVMPRLFDLQSDFLTVTYYLKEVADDRGHLTGALIRRLNGTVDNALAAATDQELVRGVERLDFRYGVMDASGDTHFYSAAEVDRLGAEQCPSTSPMPVSAHDPGCAWRALQSVEVHLLMDGERPLYILSPEETAYAYEPDGQGAGVSRPAMHRIKPAEQGFDEHLLRREFSALIAVRNGNP